MLGLRGEAGTVEVVGKYRVVLPLGQGGTADVYLAVAEGPSGFTKLVVLKVLRRNLASDTEFRLMFLGEARLAARLHHPNVVQTNEVIEVDGAPVLVMEYLDGQPLSQVITRGKQGAFTLPMQLRVIADALAGLHAAHELADFDGTPLGVVHRDVSPHNLFVTLEGHAGKMYRQILRRAERDGLRFRILQNHEVDKYLPELRKISTDWLQAKDLAERQFSIGYFDDEYMRRFPCAIVEHIGEPCRVMGFANLLEAPDRGELSVDLMRYRTDDDREIDARLREWLHHRPGAEFGDCPGRPLDPRDRFR